MGGGLARAIQLRDRHCTTGGCDVPAEHAQIDHEIEYANGGEATQENGRVRCHPHNPYKRPRNEPPPDWEPTHERDGPHLDDERIEAAIRAESHRSSIESPPDPGDPSDICCIR